MSLCVDKTNPFPAPVTWTPPEENVVLFPDDCVNLVNSVVTYGVFAERSAEAVDLDALLRRCLFLYQKRFKSVTLRTNNPRSTALIYGTGHVVVIRSNNVFSAYYSAYRYSKIVAEILGKHDASVCDLKIQNLTATVRLPFVVDVFAYNRIDPYCFHPRAYPGMKISVPGSNINMGLSPKNLLITGASTEREIERVYEEYRERFERVSVPRDSARAKELSGAFLKKQRKMKRSDVELADELVNDLMLEGDESYFDM